MESAVFGQMLATTLWQSSLLFVLVACATWWLRDASPRLRHALWLLVLARLLVPVAPVMEAGVDFDTWAWSTNPLVLTGADAVAQEASVTTLPSFRPTGTGVVTAASTPDPARAWWAASWVLGALLVAACAWWQSRRVRRLRAGSRAATAAWSGRWAGCLRRAGLSRRVELRMADVSAPMTVGVLSPAILVPDGLSEELAADQRDAVLLHELVHIERRDLLVHALSTLARIVFFFHPVAWWTSRRLEHERELIADRESVRRAGVSARRYGETLLAVARFAASHPADSTHQLRGALAMTRGGRALADRMGRLGQPPARRGAWVAGSIVVLALGFAGQGCVSPADDDGAGSSAADLSAFLQEACHDRSIELPEAAAGTPLATREVRGVALVTADDVVVHGHLAQDGWLPVRRPLPRSPIEIAEHTAEFTAEHTAAPDRHELTLDRSGLRWNDRPLADVDELWPRLDADPSPQLILMADPTLSFGEVAGLVDEVIGHGHTDLIFVGIPVTPERRADLKQQLETLPDTEDGELLVLTDRKAPWARHVEVVQAAAGMGIAHVSFGALDDQGRLVRVPQDLPADVGVSTPR